MCALGHQELFVQLHLERAAVKATGQGISERLLLDLRKQPGVIYGYRYLISCGSQQQYFVFMPDPGRIIRLHLESAHQSLVKNKWRYREWQSIGVLFNFIITIMDDDCLMTREMRAMPIQVVAQFVGLGRRSAAILRMKV